MARITLDQELLSCQKRIREEIEHWKYIEQYGCHDPFWPDGCNMNLTRNHIIYYKRRIEEICQELSRSLPEEYYLPLPPKVDDNYMANLKQEGRVNRLRQQGTKITTKKTKFDEGQLSFL